MFTIQSIVVYFIDTKLPIFYFSILMTDGTVADNNNTHDLGIKMCLSEQNYGIYFTCKRGNIILVDHGGPYQI